MFSGALGDLGWYCIRLGIIAFNQGKDETLFSSTAASAEALWPLYCTAKCNNWSEERVPLDCEVVVSSITSNTFSFIIIYCYHFYYLFLVDLYSLTYYPLKQSGIVVFVVTLICLHVLLNKAFMETYSYNYYYHYCNYLNFF